ncbi:MAG: AAA family ATPase [Okeania sp. SIO3I5]|uniref:AAA family ATPase n=1 Tax=Okeania sp. SIO3I5 TaxID=2607805 RepID=UPI0013B62A75|nr:AAA family ATPase [Okeania sp. SIO3I5]NEQ35387.1 AAA family ATPase [Okeania sp. SIO3I5]
MNNQPQLLTPTTPYPTIFQQYIRQKTENYVDRSLISTTINNFLQNHNHGYFTLIGSPGSGKSAILANYTIQNPQTVYYTAEVEGKNRADEFLITLCTQLIQKIDHQNPTLPDNVTEGSWYLSLLLQKISDNLTAEEKLIVVVDGCDNLDRQSQPRDSNIFYLPRYLPKQVYFLLARRPFLRAKSGLLIETPAETLNLEQFPEQNQADARAYIQHYLAIPEVGANIKSWVAENYQSEAEFCRELVAESGNNFMYLSRVLGGIPPNPPLEGGDRKWRDIPSGLEEYYQGLWQKMVGDGLSEIELGVLRVLVEQEEVSVEAIAESIDTDEYDVEEVLETWLEFLHWQEIGGEICYSLYHWSFRNFLRVCL